MYSGWMVTYGAVRGPSTQQYVGGHLALTLHNDRASTCELILVLQGTVHTLRYLQHKKQMNVVYKLRILIHSLLAIDQAPLCEVGNL